MRTVRRAIISVLKRADLREAELAPIVKNVEAFDRSQSRLRPLPTRDSGSKHRGVMVRPVRTRLTRTRPPLLAQTNAPGDVDNVSIEEMRGLTRQRFHAIIELLHAME